MKLDYHKVWKTMNSLESVTSKICSAREILDSAIDALENHKLEKTETLLYAVDEYLQYYLEEFDRKFKDAWAETVTKVHQETIKIDDLRRSWDPPGMWDIPDYYENVAPSATQRDIDDYSTEHKGSTVISVMPPWGHSDMEALRYTDEEMDAMCDNAAKQDKVIRWQLPVEEIENGDTGEQEYFITFPEDLLEAASLKLGDIVSWIDNGDGTYTLKHKTMSDTITPGDPYKDEMIAAGYKMVDGVWTMEKKPLNHDEMVAAGYTMTADGFWI